LELKPEQKDYTNTVVIVDGCPVVDQTKAELLTNVLIKKFSAVGEITYSNMPRDANQHTKGYMFIGYQTPDLAAKAVDEMNNFQLDKAHTLLVTLLSDFEQSVNVKAEWTPIEKKPYVERGNLRSWLLNEYCRDQFALLEKNGDACSVYWHATNEVIPVEQREYWSEGWVQWSPQGTYLATMHQKGVILWGGEHFQRVGRFAHADVRLADFSPQERFMVTLSVCQGDEANQTQSLVEIIIWDVLKGTACRRFTSTIETWPTFKWSNDDAYAATLQSGKIYIYETENFRMLDKKPLAANVGISDFSWSPTDRIIAYWVAETANTPARVALVSVPSRNELCTKNLFSVAEISLIWHPQGDFLAVQVLRCNKKKVDSDKQVKYMGTFVNFEIVRMRAKLYPVDQVALKDAVSCFQWESNGNRFAFVKTGSGGSVSVPIYELTKAGKVREVSVLSRDGTRINDLRWSPKGNTFVIANLKGADTSIEFIDANECQSLAKVEHPMATELHWDSTGRYVASVVTSFTQKSDNAVWFWSSIGRPLHQMSVTGLRIFSWRPFPPTLLSAEQIQASVECIGFERKLMCGVELHYVPHSSKFPSHPPDTYVARFSLQALKKSLASKYSAHFDTQDKMLASEVSRELMRKRNQMMSDFAAWRENLLNRYRADKPKRDALRGKLVVFFIDFLCSVDASQVRLTVK
uniref:Eukaryotic translation initiation factor 3 subunit B n=1 Tax=Schistocephalus solidus TaxID=70667 RepID=A0A183TG83_SCHSO